jgi:hypothetical protein
MLFSPCKDDLTPALPLKGREILYKIYSIKLIENRFKPLLINSIFFNETHLKYLGKKSPSPSRGGTG